MTITIDPQTIIDATSDRPSTSGQCRRVWLLPEQGIVIKKNRTDAAAHRYAVEACQREVTNYNNFGREEYTIYVEGFGDITVKFPETVMVGDCVVQEMVYGEHAEGPDDFDLALAVSEFGASLGLTDIHDGNFLWDEMSMTVWIVDFSD